MVAWMKFVRDQVIAACYRVEAFVGSGAIAEVYRVRHLLLGSTHALKVLAIPNAAIEKRLIQEGRVQASFRHPNVVVVTDAVDLEDGTGLVMEYVDGPPLSRLISMRPMPLRQASWVALGIMRGVAMAHRNGMVHRDLKPANILVGVEHGVVVPRVIDFGLAKVLRDDTAGPTLTRSGATLGTPAYMAPEQIRNAKNVDNRADLFAVGAILYELLSGRRAFPERDRLKLFEDVSEARYTPIRDLVPDIPAPMERAIQSALTAEPGERVADCEALIATWLDQAPGRASAGLWTPNELNRIRGLGPGPEEDVPPGAVVQSTWPGAVRTVVPAKPEVGSLGQLLLGVGIGVVAALGAAITAWWVMQQAAD